MAWNEVSEDTQSWSPQVGDQDTAIVDIAVVDYAIVETGDPWETVADDTQTWTEQ